MVDAPQFGDDFLTVSPSQEGCPGRVQLWESAGWGRGLASRGVLAFSAAASYCPSPDPGVDRPPGPQRPGERLTRPPSHAEAAGSQGMQGLWGALVLSPEPQAERTSLVGERATRCPPPPDANGSHGCVLVTQGPGLAFPESSSLGPLSTTPQLPQSSGDPSGWEAGSAVTSQPADGHVWPCAGGGRHLGLGQAGVSRGAPGAGWEGGPGSARRGAAVPGGNR